MRSGFAVRDMAGLVGLSLLAACGVRVVKEQAAASFVDTGQKAVAATQQFYQDLVKANNAYNGFRWAVDPQCPLLAPGERVSAPAIDDPTALPLAIERLPGGKLPHACAAYAAEACHRRAGGSLDCHPAAGAVRANGFFCPSEAAQACAPALASADWKRVSRYSGNPVNPQASYLSLAAGDFSADADSIRILSHYLDSLSAVAHGGDEDLAAELGHEADALRTLTQHLHAAAAHTTTAASASAAAAGKDDLVAPLVSLASGIRSSANQGGSADAIAKVLRQPGAQQQISDAIEQLARAVDGKFCSTQPADALRSASDISMYLGFGYGPNDLAARETLVKQAIDYKSLVASSLAACSAAQAANAADAQGAYHPASPSAVLLMGVKRANDTLVREIVKGELSEAERQKAREISFQQFEAAIEKAASLVSSLQAL